MAWFVLIVAGMLEAVWASALAASNGFGKWRPALVFIVAMAASVGGLGWAMQFLPTGTAYAVWVGVGASLTVLYSIATGRERASVARLGLLVLLVGSVIGLKVVS